MIKIYDQSELVAALTAQFPAARNTAVLNSKYCATTREWVEKYFASYVWNIEIARDQLKYSKRANQCEHFSLRAALEVVDLFSKMPEDAVPPEAESMAIAVCKYLRADGKGWHESNLWFCGGQWLPWEPQERRFFEFTESERLTVQQVILL